MCVYATSLSSLKSNKFLCGDIVSEGALNQHLPFLQLLAPGMNVYGPASPFTLQGLAQGKMCTQVHTCVRPEVMIMRRYLTF